jgi:hypothetical protein
LSSRSGSDLGTIDVDPEILSIVGTSDMRPFIERYRAACRTQHSANIAMGHSSSSPITNVHTVLSGAHTIKVFSNHRWSVIRITGRIHPSVNGYSFGRIE